jgi:hypothetical protein
VLTNARSAYWELEPLSQLLTGKYPPNTVYVAWSTSTNVDVIVVDIKHDPADAPTIERVREIDHLQRMTTEDIPQTIALRLYLVEDMTAPVIELLGSAYNCNPFFFQHHMRCIGGRPSTKIDEKGNPLPGIESAFRLHTPEEAPLPSGLRNLPFFSLPFRRLLDFTGEGNAKSIVRERTIFRQLLEDFRLLEERVTGTLQSSEPGRPMIGQSNQLELFPSQGHEMAN